MENNELTDYVAHTATALRGCKDNGILCALVVGLDYDQFVRADLEFLHDIGATVRENVANLEYAYDQSYKWARIGAMMALSATKFARFASTIGVAAILALDHEGFKAFKWLDLERTGIISATPWFAPQVWCLPCDEYAALREAARRAVLAALA